MHNQIQEEIPQRGRKNSVSFSALNLKPTTTLTILPLTVTHRTSANTHSGSVTSQQISVNEQPEFIKVSL